MKLQSADLLGIFVCEWYPDDHPYEDDLDYDALFIYHDESERLFFNSLLSRTSNHSHVSEFREGFVYLQPVRHEIYLRVQHHYKWSPGTGKGYEAEDYYDHADYGAQGPVEVFRLLDKRQIALFRRQKEQIIYKRIPVRETDELSYRESSGFLKDKMISTVLGIQWRDATDLKDKIIDTRLWLHEHWQDLVKQPVRAEHIPISANDYLQRGSVRRASGLYEEAEADFTRAIQLRSDHAYAYYSRGSLYSYNLQRYEQAIHDFDQFIRLRPDSARAHFDRGTAYIHLQQYEQALADLDKTIASDPEQHLLISAYHNRGTAHMRSQAYQQALADFEQVVELDPESANGYDGCGCCHHFLGRYYQAIADYDRAIELDPANALFYSNRGEAYQCLLQFEEAIADFELALALKPDLPRTGGYLIEARSQMKNSDL